MKQTKNIKVSVLVVMFAFCCVTIMNESSMTNDMSPDNIKAQNVEQELFNSAVSLIKRFEGWHGYKCMPYVGYGHRLLQTDHISLPLTEHEADSILRDDLRKRMALVDGNFKAKLLLGMLSYNVGQSRVLGSNNRLRSKVAKLLLSGAPLDTAQIRKEYVSWRKWNGRVVKSIERRRNAEFNLIFRQ